ncbi:MAG: chemotaxis protein CheW [Frankiales bacterium]|jgi:hypothetical protein|nr:chemotaxis protein CheW [Frankiales bacterium]
MEGVEKVQVRPERTTLAVVLVAFLGALPLGLSSPWLAPALLVPLAALVWVLRARVVAAAAGLEICNGLRVRRFGWDEVAGFEVPDRGPVKLLLTSGQALRLSALSRRDLPRVLEAGQPA